MGTSKRLAEHYDRQSEERLIAKAASAGPQQSLSDRELALERRPVTIYPRALQRRVKAWVRLGPEVVHVYATLLRSTPTAAGIEVKAQDQVYRCWVWGNAVEVDDATEDAASTWQRPRART
ncbi:MAG TPA: hypothetical protein VN035_07525 [Microbacterium sp.]|nr:hypothetical protein [Microbacterium sp.]